MKQIHFVKQLLVVLLAVVGILPVWGGVVSGTTYTLTSTNGVPTGWTNSGCSVGSSYTSVANGDYLTTDDICVGSLTSIQINARYYGGSGTTAAVKFEFITSDGKTTYNLGTLTPTTNKESASYTLSSFTQSISANTEGHFKISAPNATSSKYVGLKAVKFTFTTGTCGAATPTPTVELSAATVDFGTVTKGASVAAKTISATLTNTSSATAALSGSGASAFSISPTSLTESGDITITPNTSTAGTYSATLTLSATGATSATATISMTVEAPFEGTVVTLSPDAGADIKFVLGSTSAQFWSNATPLTAKGITLGGTGTSYYDGSVVRFYQSNTFTITPASGVTIKKIEIVRQSTTGSNTGVINCSGLTASSENTTTNTNIYTGSTTSAVTFTASAQARFTAIKVYYTGTPSGGGTTTYTASITAPTNGSIKMCKTENGTYGTAQLTGLNTGDWVWFEVTPNSFYQISTVKVNNSTDGVTYISDLANDGKAYKYQIGSADITISATFAAASCSSDPEIKGVSACSASSFECNGISSFGTNCSITDYGFVYGTAENPRIGTAGCTKLQVGTTYKTANTAFSKDVSGITFTNGTKYYVCTYATNGHGTVYSADATFTPMAEATTITLNANGKGTNGEVTIAYNAYSPNSPRTWATPTAGTGWTCAGYTTAANNDVYVMAANGGLGYDISGYTNASSQWIYPNATLTLYAQWNATTLTAPSNLSATNINSNSATLSWDAVTGASSYTIYIMDADLNDQTIEGINTNSYSITGLSQGTTYTWTVKAVGNSANGWNTGSESADAEFSTTSGSCAITWMVAGQVYTTGNPTLNVTEGNKVTTLPTAPDALGCASSFAGWSETNMGSTYGQANPGNLFTTAAGSPTINTAKTFYAVFVTSASYYITECAACKYTVTFDKNAEDAVLASTSTQVNCYDTEAQRTITLPTPTRSGYTCTGWYESAISQTKYGDCGAAYVVSETVTMVAHWEAAAHTITWSVSPAGAGKIQFNTKDVASPVASTTGAQPNIKAVANSGYTFVSWTATPTSVNTALSGKGATTSFTMPDADVTLTANFKRSISPTLSYSSATLNPGGTASPTLNGNTCSGTVSYSSSNTSVATVNASTGVVTAVAVGTTTITATIAANGECQGGTATATITVQKAQYSVTWMINGSQAPSGSQTTAVDQGSAITTLPASPASSACDGEKVFVGWTNQAISIATDTKPAVLYTSASQFPTPEANVTYYAVFATQSGSPATWNQVTTLAGITEGTYVIKNGNYVLSNEVASSSAPAALAAPTVTSSVMTGTVADNMKWVLTSTGTANQFYVKNPDGKYLYETNNNNGLRVNTTSDKWTFATNTNGYFAMKGANNSRYCAQYAAGSDWRSYTSATATNYTNSGKIELYKLSGAGVTNSGYITECNANKYDVTYDNNGHGTAPEAQNQVSSVVLSDISVTGWKCTGWKANQATTVNSTNVAANTLINNGSRVYLTANTTFTAQWQQATSVTFDAQGGTPATSYNTIAVGSSEACCVIPTKTGYTFLGWFTAASSGSKVYAADGTIQASVTGYTANSKWNYTANASVTLYAQWKQTEYTITYNLNGGNNAAGNPATYTNTTPTITFLDATRSGYRFDGWYAADDFTGEKVTQIPQGSTGNVNLYAKWTQMFAISFIDKDGVNGSLAMSAANGEEIVLPDAAIDCNEYNTFEGWVISAGEIAETTDKPTIYKGTYAVTGATTFRALYSKCTGSVAEKYEKVTSNSEVTDGEYVLITNHVTESDRYVYIGQNTSSGSTDYGNSTNGITFTDGKVKPGDLPAAAVVLTITAGTGVNAGKFAMYNGSKYLAGASGNYLNSNVDNLADAYLWHLTDGSNVNSNECPAGAIQPVDYTTRVLQKNNSNTRFACYTNTQTNYVFLYKKSGGCQKYYATNPSCVTPDDYTITYDPNTLYGGNSATRIEETTAWHTATTVKTITQAGFTASSDRGVFVGWNTSADGTGEAYTAGAPIQNKTITLFAQWENRYYVHFYDGSHAVESSIPALRQTSEGAAVDLSGVTGTLACGDYTWVGWATNNTVYKDNKTVNPTIVTEVTPTDADINVYALYTSSSVSSDFTADCAGGTYYISANDGAKVMSDALNSSGKAYDYIYYHDQQSHECGKVFTFTKIAANTYTIQDEDGKYLCYTKDAYYDQLSFEASNSDNKTKWTISAGSYEGKGAWCIQNNDHYNSNNYCLQLNGNYFQGGLVTSVSSSGVYNIDLTPAAGVASSYHSNPNCGPYTVTFYTNGGSMTTPDGWNLTETSKGVYVSDAIAAGNTKDITFTAASYDDWTFVGWKENAPQDDVNTEPIGYITAGTPLTITGQKEYYAVYSRLDDAVEFDPKVEQVYNLYALTAGGDAKYVSYTALTSSGSTMSALDNCTGAANIRITPGTGENAGKFQLTILGENGASDIPMGAEASGTKLQKSSAWWIIEESTSGKGTYRIHLDGNADRAMCYNGSSFGHYAVSQVNSSSQAAYRDMEIGKCQDMHYTSTPDDSPVSVKYYVAGELVYTVENIVRGGSVPAYAPDACPSGKVFVGWATPSYSVLYATPKQTEPTLATRNGSLSDLYSDVSLHAIFASQNGWGEYNTMDEFADATLSTSNANQTYGIWTVNYGKTTSIAEVTTAKMTGYAMQLQAHATENGASMVSTNKIKGFTGYAADIATTHNGVSFKIQYSTDGEAWTDLLGSTSHPGDRQKTHYSHSVVSPIDAYFRILLSASDATGATYRVYVDNLEIFSTPYAWYYTDYSTSCDKAASASVTWAMDGGAIDGDEPVATLGNYLTLPDAHKDCMHLDGWKPTIEGDVKAEIYAAGDRFLVNHNVTLTAQWSDDPLNCPHTYTSDPTAFALTSTAGVTVRSTTTGILNVTGTTDKPVAVLSGTNAALFTVTIADGYTDKGDGSYDWNYTVDYTPTANNALHTATVTFRETVEDTPRSYRVVSCDVALNGRSLPDQFAIVMKNETNGKWYALSNALAATAAETVPMPINVEVDNTTTPTKVTYGSKAVLYQAAARWKSTEHLGALRLQSVANSSYITATKTDNTSFYMPAGNDDDQQFYLNSTNLSAYSVTLDPASGSTRSISMYAGKIGWFNTVNNTVYFLPVEAMPEGEEMDVVDWKKDASGNYTIVFNVTNWRPTYAITASVAGGAFTEITRNADRTVDVALGAQTPDNAVLVALKLNGDLKSSAKYRVPFILDGGNLQQTGKTADSYVIVNSGTVTVDENVNVKNIQVKPDASLVVNSGKTLIVDRIVLRGEPWLFPNLRNNGTITAQEYYYTRRVADKEHYYQFAVPYEVAAKDIVLTTGIKPAYSSAWVLKSYDGAARATYGMNEATNWVEKPAATAVAPRTGYEMWSNSNLYREYMFPFATARLNDASPVAVTLTANAAVNPIDNGWNFVVSPLTYDYTVTSFNGAAPSAAPKLAEMYEDGRNYYQFSAHGATIRAFSPFYYQAATNGSMTFGSDGTITCDAGYVSGAQFAPARIAEEQLREQWIQLFYEDANGLEDQTNIYIKPQFSVAYETGLDVVKMSTSGDRPLVYTQLPCGDLAFAAIPDSLAETRIPLAVNAAQEGRMTFSLRDNDWLDRLEHVYLVDDSLGITTDLFADNYSYLALAGNCTGRFYLRAEFRAPGIATDVSEVDDGGGDYHVVVSEGMISIQGVTAGTDIRMYDAVGHLMLQTKASGNQVNLTVPATGVYLLKVANTINKVVLDK